MLQIVDGVLSILMGSYLIKFFRQIFISPSGGAQRAPLASRAVRRGAQRRVRRGAPGDHITGRPGPGRGRRPPGGPPALRRRGPRAEPRAVVAAQRGPLRGAQTPTLYCNMQKIGVVIRLSATFAQCRVQSFFRKSNEIILADLLP